MIYLHEPFWTAKQQILVIFGHSGGYIGGNLNDIIVSNVIQISEQLYRMLVSFLLVRKYRNLDVINLP